MFLSEGRYGVPDSLITHNKCPSAVTFTYLFLGARVLMDPQRVSSVLLLRDLNESGMVCGLVEGGVKFTFSLHHIYSAKLNTIQSLFRKCRS